MKLETAFYAFESAGSEAMELNIALSKVRERLAATGVRVVNVETVPATSFLGFQVQAGGLRVWYESGVEHGQAKEERAEQKYAEDLNALIAEASDVAEALWSRVSRTGQLGHPPGETSDAMKSAALIIDRLVAQARAEEPEGRQDALHLLANGLCRIREAAFDAPAHVMEVADVLHNIPGILAGEDRAGETYLKKLLHKGQSLIDDISWGKSA